MTAGLPPSKITLASRIGLALSGLMVSLPFLNFHHSLPLPTFHTEWMAFALGSAALLALTRGKQTGFPFLSLGLIGLMLVLMVQVALGMVAYAERSLLGALYVLWAALLVWLGAHLREHCGVERVGLVLQGFVAFGGFLVAITGFMLYYQIDWAGFRLISGAGMDGMVGTIAQRNNFANYLGCALASVVFLFGRRRLSLPLATLLAAPLVLGLVLSISRSAWIYVLLISISVCWTFWLGDRERSGQQRRERQTQPTASEKENHRRERAAQIVGEVVALREGSNHPIRSVSGNQPDAEPVDLVVHEEAGDRHQKSAECDENLQD